MSTKYLYYRYLQTEYKKIPTRTGPCCAPSACYPC